MKRPKMKPAPIAGFAVAAGLAWAGAEVEPTLRDKSLVAWVAVADLDQRGGSVLTIDDGGEAFDGLVFGELAPRKWMAGSDHYRRSNRAQETVAAETADARTFVQVALVYSGKDVSLYRNGELWSRHVAAGEAPEFDRRSRINIGKRHRTQADPAHFAGRIDDARIYAQALTAEQLRGLRANERSAIKPWAWWSFDTADAKDRCARFLDVKLAGGATIEDGCLHLDGKSGQLLAALGKDVPIAWETPARPATPPADWLVYHLAHPGPGTAVPGDPNCAFYWKGRYHLHYIYTHRDGYAFAHVSSTDMVRWTWHPTTLTPPKTGHGMFSGTGFFTKDGKPAVIYHGQGSGRNQIAVALDDKLEKWSDPMPLEPHIQAGQDAGKIAHWDPDAWLEGTNYYALSGGSPGSGKPPTLFRSGDLTHWDYLGLFMTRDMPDVRRDEDVSCPNFFKIGNQHMLLCISHTLGCRYYLGTWRDEQFTPEFHARMNWRGWDFFAPESLLAPDGRRVMWAWCNFGHPQSGIQSLPRELSLPADGVLRIKPLRELRQLRGDARQAGPLVVADGTGQLLAGMAGDTLELELRFARGAAGRFGVEVLCDANGKGVPVAVEPAAKVLAIGDLKAPLDVPPDEAVTLRVFLDKNLIEVFANDRQAAVASHRHDPGDTGIRIFSAGGETRVEQITAWPMRSIYQKQISTH